MHSLRRSSLSLLNRRSAPSLRTRLLAPRAGHLTAHGDNLGPTLIQNLKGEEPDRQAVVGVGVVLTTSECEN